MQAATVPELRHRGAECGSAGGAPEVARIEPMEAAGLIGVRADLGDPAVRRALETASRCDLPHMREASFDSDGRPNWYWMAPDELLLRVSPDEAAGMTESLEAALSGMHCLVVDLSDSRAFFRISGPGAREIIAKGAPVDLHPEAFRKGLFRRTRVADVAAAFCLVSEHPDVFELFCARSYARYLRDWLVNAARTGSLIGLYAPADRDEPGSGMPTS